MSVPAYRSYKDSGINWLGDIPAHWEVKKLGRLVDPHRSITYGIVQAGPDIPGGVPYIRPADMTDENGVLDEQGLLKTSVEIADAYSRSQVHAGDLVCSIGPSFGKVMVVPSSLHGANLTQGTARIAVAKEAECRFVFWALRSEPSVHQWEAGIGGATFRALNLDPLSRTLLAVPPPAEQAAIAAFLDRETGRIDALVEEQRRLIALLKEKRQAVISHAVTKGLNPQAPLKPSGIEWLGDIPTHWEVKPLRALIGRIEAGTSVNAVDKPAEGDEIGVLKTSCVYDGTFRADENKAIIPEEEDRASCPVKVGCLIVSRMNTPDLVGATGLVREPAPGLFLPDRLWQVHLENVEPEFLYRWTGSVEYRAQVKIACGGTSSSMQNLSQDGLLSFRLAVPPRPEQAAIAAFLDGETGKIDALVGEAERGITLLQERRAALVSAAVTGKIDVRGLVAAPRAKEAA